MTRLLRHPVAAPLVGALIVIAALAVRLHDLNRYGFNSDEAVYSGQAAALAGHQDYAHLFGVFRAHPLLVHVIVSLIYRITGVNDVAPRLVAVAFGVGLVILGGAIGWLVRGRLAGLLTMLFIALCPYAVIVSRQMLLDGPMAFFFALCVLFLALYVRTPSRLTLFAAACAAGLAFLSKETAILMVPAILVFFLLATDVPLRRLDLLAASGVYALTIAPFPLALWLSGGGGVAQQFLIWQVFRRPNHTPDFYLSVIPSLTIPIVGLAVIGTVIALRRREGIDVLIVALPLAMIAFFEAWPVKGFQYLVPVVAPIALLATDGLVGISRLAGRAVRRMGRPALPARTATAVAIGIACAVILGSGVQAVLAGAPALVAIRSTDSDDVSMRDSPPPLGEGRVGALSFTAGTGGLEASRPVGDWIRANTLPDARMLTIGPSFANVIQFYGGRRARALSVSPNPLHRNPTYEPVLNPDLLLRTNAVQYLAYDSYSAARTPFFTKKLMALVKKYHGILVYEDEQPVRGGNGRLTRVPVVRIYAVHP
jgi:predicted membrane-bound mannosyltransferase